MSTIIDKLKDKFGNFVLPVTNTKAVYDDDGNRLDGVLNNINSSLVEITNADHYADAPLNQIIIQWVNKYAPTVGNKNVMGSIENNEGKYHISAYVDRYKNATGVLTQYGGESINFSCYGGSLVVINQLASVKTISDAFDLSKTYSQGEFCIYDNTLWKSKVNNNQGNIPYEEDYWTATSVSNEISGMYKIYHISGTTDDFGMIWIGELPYKPILCELTSHTESDNWLMTSIAYWKSSGINVYACKITDGVFNAKANMNFEFDIYCI